MMFSIYMALWELPSGLIADGIGRRTSLALAGVVLRAAPGVANQGLDCDCRARAPCACAGRDYKF